MSEQLIISAQVRAARALLSWSQEELAGKAGVSITTVRDIERERRPTNTDATHELRGTLEHAGVIFVSGTAREGPGVRLAANRPHLIREPEMTKPGDLVFGVEWQGREVNVSVAYEVISDFGGDQFMSRQPDAAYVKVFRTRQDKILDAAAAALAAGKIVRDNWVMLTAEDFPGLPPLPSLST